MLRLSVSSLQVYDGPIATRHDGYSRQRHYASSCPQPKRLAIIVDSKFSSACHDEMLVCTLL